MSLPVCMTHCALPLLCRPDDPTVFTDAMTAPAAHRSTVPELSQKPLTACTWSLTIVIVRDGLDILSTDTLKVYLQSPTTNEVWNVILDFIVQRICIFSAHWQNEDTYCICSKDVVLNHFHTWFCLFQWFEVLCLSEEPPELFLSPKPGITRDP